MDTLDSVVIEKAVSVLPVKHREAIRWAYVRKHDPAGMARHLAVSKQGLAELVGEGLTMLTNKVCKPSKYVLTCAHSLAKA